MLVSQLFEARNPKVNYVPLELKGKVERVTAVLEGHESAKFTNLAKRYKQLDRIIKALDVQLNEKKVILKSKMDEYWDASDIVYTRALQTCSLTLSLSKKTLPGLKDDYEAAFNKLVADLNVLVPELTEKIEELKVAALKETQKKSAGQDSKLTIKIDEGVRSFFTSLISKFKSWASKYDSKLDKMKVDLANLKPKK